MFIATFASIRARRARVAHSGCRALAAMALLLIPAAAPAADVSIKPGDRVIQAQIQTPAQLQLIESMDLDIWSHEHGIGPVDIHVSTAERQALDAAGITYTTLMDDLLAAYERERAGNAEGGPWSAYMDLPTIIAFINNLATLRPDLCQVIDIGDTIEGRDIFAIRITGPNPGPKPAVFYHGLQHAREWVTGPTVLYLANHLVTTYDADPCIRDLVDRTEIFLAPCVNPDGYAHSWVNSNTRLWRKNRRLNGDGTYGVDLNRNWGYQWGGGGSSGTPSNETYRGTAPFSEPETTSLSNFILAHPNIAAYMDYHSYSQLLMWPWGYECILPPEPDASTFDFIGSAMRAQIFAVHGVDYVDGPVCSTIYQASGTSVDWVYGAAGRTPYTIELRPAGGNPGFLLPPEQILPNCEENLPGILHLTRWASSGVLIDLPPGVAAPATLIAGQPTPITVTITPRLEAYVPGSGTLHYRLAGPGPFTAVPLTNAGGNSYAAALPAFPCGAQIEYYFSALGSEGYQAALPCAAPTNVYGAVAVEVAFADDFESDLGWSAAVSGATAGQWQRGVPVNDPSWDYDPAADADGSGSCFLTQNTLGNSDVDNGAVLLTSPAMDLSGGDIRIEYAYYLNLTNQNGADRLLVEINTADGVGPWTQIALHTSNGGLSWRWHVIDQPALDAAGVVPSAASRLRFTANDANPQSVVEAGVDALRITRTCDLACPTILGDMNADGGLSGLDIAGFVDANLLPPNYHPCADLAAPAGVLDPADLAAFVAALLAA